MQMPAVPTLHPRMQGNCTSNNDTDPDRRAKELRSLFAALPAGHVPLKPFQCLLLTDANTLFLDNAHGFWLDNLYFGITQPRTQTSQSAASILSTGQAEARPSVVTVFDKPMNVFMTNISVHGHGLESFSSRILSLTNHVSRLSLLFQGPQMFAKNSQLWPGCLLLASNVTTGNSLLRLMLYVLPCFVFNGCFCSWAHTP